MKLPAADPMNTAAPAISSGMPMRNSGERAVEAFSVSGLSHSALAKSVLIRPGRDAVHADIVLAVFAGEVARELHVGGLRDRVGAEHGRALQAADRGDDDDRAVLALDHLRHHHAGQPVVGDDVVVEDLAELIVGNAAERTVIRDWTRRCRPARRSCRRRGWIRRPGAADFPCWRCWPRSRPPSPCRTCR